jgi:Zn-dependent M16 (insulinase) family peptidase
MAYEDLARELATHAGGLSFRLDASTRADDESDLRKYLYVRLKALPESLSDALDLLHGVLARPHFGNHERLATVLRELRNDMRSSVLPSGHLYMNLRSARGLSPSAAVEERWKGISQLLFLEELVESDIESVAARLEELRKVVVAREGATAALACEDDVQGDALSKTRAFFDRLPARAPAADGADRKDRKAAAGESGAGDAAARGPTRWESVLVSASVNYVGSTIRAAHLQEPEYIPESVLAHLLRTGFLWEEIRMKGGAYGAMAGPRALERIFNFASYRDPRIVETIEAFSRGLGEISRSGVDRSALDLAIIAGVGRDSRPLSPGQKSIVSLKRTLYGISDELRQSNRERLLSIEPEAVQEAARRLAARLEEAHTSVMGSRTAIEEAAQQYPGILEHTLELQV